MRSYPIRDNPESLVYVVETAAKLWMESESSCLTLYVPSTPLALITKCGSVFPSFLFSFLFLSIPVIVLDKKTTGARPIVCVLRPQNH